MTTVPDEEPRTLREVAIILRGIRREIAELHERFDTIRNWVITGLACPVAVGVVLYLIFQK
jgi:hypothetical protein